MSQWIDVASTADFDDGTIRAVDYEGTSIIVIRLGDAYFGLENLCTHDYTPLDEGTVEDDELICPHHGARFCVRTGEVTAPPAYEDLATYEVRVENGIVQVCVDKLID